MNELNHVAIIMDGNGRWAQQRNLDRSFGHEAGSKKVRELTIFAAKKGIKILTLYAFSTENWKRPKSEISFLMKLLSKYLKNELSTFMENGIRFTTIGDLSIFEPSLQKTLEMIKEKTKDNANLTQILALNYGSRDEIARACKSLVLHNKDITTQGIESCLDTRGFPDVDMIIRTGGERRLSNFMLWQSAYAEIFFTQTLWPDFSKEEFGGMIEEFLQIKRRFGGL